MRLLATVAIDDAAGAATAVDLAEDRYGPSMRLTWVRSDQRTPCLLLLRRAGRRRAARFETVHVLWEDGALDSAAERARAGTAWLAAWTERVAAVLQPAPFDAEVVAVVRAAPCATRTPSARYCLTRVRVRVYDAAPPQFAAHGATAPGVVWPAYASAFKDGSLAAPVARPAPAPAVLALATLFDDVCDHLLVDGKWQAAADGADVMRAVLQRLLLDARGLVPPEADADTGARGTTALARAEARFAWAALATGAEDGPAALATAVLSLVVAQLAAAAAPAAPPAAIESVIASAVVAWLRQAPTSPGAAVAAAIVLRSLAAHADAATTDALWHAVGGGMWPRRTKERSDRPPVVLTAGGSLRTATARHSGALEARAVVAAALTAGGVWSAPAYTAAVQAAADRFVALPAATLFSPMQSDRRQGNHAGAAPCGGAAYPSLSARRSRLAVGGDLPAWTAVAELTTLVGGRGIPAGVAADRLFQHVQDAAAAGRMDHWAPRERVAQAALVHLVAAVVPAMPLPAWSEGAAGVARWELVQERLQAWTTLAIDDGAVAPWAAADRLLLLHRVTQLAAEVNALVEEAKDRAATAGPESGAVRLVRDWALRQTPIYAPLARAFFSLADAGAREHNVGCPTFAPTLANLR